MTNRRKKSKAVPNRQACCAVPAEAPLDYAGWAEGLLTKYADDLGDDDIALLRSQVKAISAMPAAVKSLSPDPTAVEIVRDHKSLRRVGEILVGATMVAIDLETTSLDPLHGEIVGVGLAMAAGNYYFPICHRVEQTGMLRPDQLPLKVVVQELDLAKLPLVAHNGKFEFRWLRRHAGITCHFMWDTMLAARLLAPHLPADLKQLASRELDVPDWGMSKAEIEVVQFLPIDKVGRYCAKDCRYTLDLLEKQRSCLA